MTSFDNTDSITSLTAKAKSRKRSRRVPLVAAAVAVTAFGTLGTGVAFAQPGPTGPGTTGPGMTCNTNPPGGPMSGNTPESLFAYTTSNPVPSSPTLGSQFNIYYLDETPQYSVTLYLNGSPVSGAVSTAQTTSPSAGSYTYVDNNGGSEGAGCAVIDTVNVPVETTAGTYNFQLVTHDSDGNEDMISWTDTVSPGTVSPMSTAVGGIGVAILGGAGLLFATRRRRRHVAA
jgi:hypothetical protein